MSSRKNVVSKRAFVRGEGKLLDEYEEPGGKGMRVILSDDRLGETSTEVHHEHSSELLDRLLAELEAGNVGAPGTLVAFANDPRVQPALIRATRRVPDEDLANFAQALGLTGGEGAAEVLRERMERLLKDPKTFADDAFFNWKAGSLASVAAALLRLGSDPRRAAEVIVRFLTHPCSGNRQTAARYASEALQRTLPDDVRQLLLSSTTPLLAADDVDAFGAIAPALAEGHLDAVLGRCEALLQEPDIGKREVAIRVMGELRHERALRLLATHLPHERSLRLACSTAMKVVRDVPTELLVDLARRTLADESPSLRLAGLSLLGVLPAEEAFGIARGALADEPDPLLQKRLGGFASV